MSATVFKKLHDSLVTRVLDYRQILHYTLEKVGIKILFGGGGGEGIHHQQ